VRLLDTYDGFWVSGVTYVGGVYSETWYEATTLTAATTVRLTDMDNSMFYSGEEIFESHNYMEDYYGFSAAAKNFRYRG
jgi:hypothetical protein